MVAQLTTPITLKKCTSPKQNVARHFLLTMHLCLEELWFKCFLSGGASYPFVAPLKMVKITYLNRFMFG
jgi:hypothetical protein